jgi:hypothetical protein
MNTETITVKIEEHDKKIEEHENKINNLEISDVRHEGKTEELCVKIERLIEQNNKWFYALVVGMASLLIKLLFFK